MKALTLRDLIDLTGLSGAHLRRLARKPKNDPSRIPGAFAYKGRKHLRYMDGKPLRQWIDEVRKWSLRRAYKHRQIDEVQRLLKAWGRNFLEVRPQPSDYVDYREPVPGQLIKDKLLDRGPKYIQRSRFNWPDMCEGPIAFVKIYVAFNAAGDPVECVDWKQATVAADENGHDIFNNTPTVRRVLPFRNLRRGR